MSFQSMRTTYNEALARGRVATRSITIDKERLPRLAGLAAIVLLAGALRFGNLSALGYANHYYAAAVESMLQSWHNFFFVAAEPGGAVSVDKPPVGLWLQAISAYFFGVNGFGLLLPQILAGIASVVLLYHLVGRRFGTVAGLVSALALAITPVVVATDRNNTMDSTLILTLLLASWAFILATEQGSLRSLLIGAALVGVGFNVKMLEAYLPLPAFYALYFLGSQERLWRKTANLAAASALLVIVSFSWAVVVDLTPPDQRPFVGSSGDNSVMSLAIGYNGTQRLLGMGGRGGLLSGLFGGNQGRAFVGAAPAGNQPPGGDGQFSRPGPGAAGTGPQPGARGDGGFQPPSAGAGDGGQPRAQGAAGGGPGGGGMPGTGQPGPLRLITGTLSKEASWLLPFGIFGALVLLFRARPRWPIAPKHQTAVLWSGWLLVGVAFFSVAGFFHEYYLSMLAPPIAALVGAGTGELWDLRGLRWQQRWIATAVLLAAAGSSLALQTSIARMFTNAAWWLPAGYAALAVGALLLIAAAISNRRRIAVAGFGCIVVAVLIAPGIWSALTTINSSANQSLPSAYGGRASGPSNGGGLNINQALMSYLQANTQGAEYLMAVPSAMQGSDYILATGRPVLILGGFMGQDRVVTPNDLSNMVARGDLRYIYWSGNGRGGLGGQAEITAWVAANCAPVQGFDTQTQNAGAPDGTSPGASRAGGAGSGGPGGMQVRLYQCQAARSP